nr:sterol desaturase family protein [Deltaproteobacteria bacterium]
MPPSLASLPLAGLALVVFACFAGLTVVSAALGFALERALPRRRVFDLPLFPGQLRFELLGNAVFLAVATVTVTLALRLGVVRFGYGGALAGALTFGVMVPGFQVFYWLLHRAMHHRALVRIHRWHHRSQVTTPLTGQSMSVFEALGWMLRLRRAPVPALSVRAHQLLGMGRIPGLQRLRQHRGPRQRRAHGAPGRHPRRHLVRQPLRVPRPAPRPLDGPLRVSGRHDGPAARHRVERLARAVRADRVGPRPHEPEGARRRSG